VEEFLVAHTSICPAQRERFAPWESGQREVFWVTPLRHHLA
jgi:hypothetical protein